MNASTDKKSHPQKPHMESVGVGPDGSSGSHFNDQLPVSPHKNMSEQDQYLLQLTGVEREQYNNLIQKNMKIRSELIEIATQMDVLAGRERAEKMEKLYEEGEGTEELKELEVELAQQENYLNELTSRLQEKRRLVNEVLKVNEIQDKENNLVYLKKKIDEVTKEKVGIEKILEKQRSELQANEIDESKKQRVGVFLTRFKRYKKKSIIKKMS